MPRPKKPGGGREQYDRQKRTSGSANVNQKDGPGSLIGYHRTNEGGPRFDPVLILCSLEVLACQPCVPTGDAVRRECDGG